MNEETLTKEMVTDWLKKHGRSRAWLAERTGCEVGTVHAWFSTRGLSPTAVAAIRVLMELDHASTSSASAVADETALIQFTSGEFERIEAARAAVGSPARPVFYRDAIIAYVEEIEEGRDDPGAVATD